MTFRCSDSVLHHETERRPMADTTNLIHVESDEGSDDSSEEFDEEQFQIMEQACFNTSGGGGLIRYFRDIFEHHPDWTTDDYLVPICIKITRSLKVKSIQWLSFFLAAHWTRTKIDDIVEKLIWGYKHNIPVEDLATNMAIDNLYDGDQFHAKKMLHVLKYPFFDIHICFLINLLSIPLRPVEYMFNQWCDHNHNTLRLYLQAIIAYKMSINEIHRALMYAMRQSKEADKIMREFELFGARTKGITNCVDINQVPQGILFRFNIPHYRHDWATEFKNKLREYQEPFLFE